MKILYYLGTTRLQKLLGFFSKKYKNRFIDIEPFKAKLSDRERKYNGRSVILRGGIQLDCKSTK